MAALFILVQFLQSIKSEVANEASAIIMPCSSCFSCYFMEPLRPANFFYWPVSDFISESWPVTGDLTSTSPILHYRHKRKPNFIDTTPFAQHCPALPRRRCQLLLSELVCKVYERILKRADILSSFHLQ